MGEDSDPEISELDIESRTWNKLNKNMKSIGYREGAAKGRDEYLQQGFDLGYSDGFKIGEHMGVIKGILSCQKELGIPTSENLEKNIQICTLCPQGNKSKVALSEEVYSKGLQTIVSRQQTHNNEIIKTVKIFYEND